jgi:predicted dehydrogenase
MTRRQFLRAASIGAAGTLVAGCETSAPQTARKISPNEKLNLGVIGTAHRASENLSRIASENIVALCDVDENFLAAAKQRFPRARTYSDFRKLLEQPDLDAVVVCTADHTHAVATAAALHLGKHVYCEKPLTHTVAEARTIARLTAANKKLATQMGTQIHATDNYRRVVELVQTDAIGRVSECHVWCEKSLGKGERPTAMPPVPSTLHWDLWLGPASARPYHPDYLPKTWRHWWDFGEGILGDMACHYMDLPFWALNLGVPITVEAEGPPVNPETTPESLIVRYQFPGQRGSAPFPLTWYDGGKRPALVIEGKVPAWPNGVLFVGEKGMLLADYSRRMLLPESQFAEFKPPSPFIPESIGHQTEWLAACKTGCPTTCNFAYASRLTETVLLGNVAYRAGQKLEWNSSQLRAMNCPQAENYLRSEYRAGWEL